ncbi:MAG: alpha-E domain-containing protein [Nevskiales bacterium]
MLARVANHLYWFGRHIERAESTARLVSVIAQLRLDMPVYLPFGWPDLLLILDAQESYQALFGASGGDADIARFLLTDERNPSSVASALARARENLRCVQDIVPREALEYVNRVHWFVREHAGTLAPGVRLNQFIEDVIYGTRLVQGLLTGTLTDGDEAFRWIDLGFNIERADMTTRIIDARAKSLSEAEETSYAEVLWGSVLKSLSAEDVYRRQTRRRVNGPEVLRYLFRYDQSPRALRHCLLRMQAHLSAQPRSEAVLRLCQRTAALVYDADVEHLTQTGLSAFLDEVQVELIRINDEIGAAYFG